MNVEMQMSTVDTSFFSTLVIGHDRFNICQKIGIPFQCFVFQNNVLVCDSPLSSIAAKLRKQH